MKRGVCGYEHERAACDICGNTFVFITSRGRMGRHYYSVFLLPEQRWEKRLCSATGTFPLIEPEKVPPKLAGIPLQKVERKLQKKLLERAQNTPRDLL